MLAMTTLTNDLYMLPKMLLVSFGLCWIWSVKQAHERQFTRLDASVIVMLLVAYAASLTAQDWRAAVFGEHSMQLESCIGLTLCALAYFGFKDADEKTVTDAVLTGAVIVSAYAIIQQKYDFMPVTIPSGRSISTIGSPPFLGCVLAACLPSALKRRVPIISGLILVAIAFTQSRAAYLGAAAGAVALEADALAARLITAIAIVAAIIIGDHGGHGDSMRIETWHTALRIFRAHPLLGVGPENFLDAFRLHRSEAWFRVTRSYLEVQDHAHNDVLHVMATMGAVGLAAYGWMLYEAWKQFKDKRYVLASIAAVFVYAKFDPTPWPALFLLAVIAGCASGKPYSGQEREEDPWVWGPAMLAATVCFYLLTPMAMADMAYKQATVLFQQGNADGVIPMRHSMRWFPAEPEYKIMAIESLFNLWRAGRKEALYEAKLVGKDLADEHPSNVQAQEMAAVASAMYAIHTFSPGAYEGTDDFLDAYIRLDQVTTMDQSSLQAYEVQAHLCAHFRDMGCFQAALVGIERVSAQGSSNRPTGMFCKLCGKPWKDHR